MRMRPEMVLNLLIVLVIAVDAFVGLQVYQQRAEAPVPLASPLTSPATATPATTPRTDGPRSEGTTEPGVVAVARGVSTRNSVQNAVISSALAFVDDGVMPADSFILQSMVPGASFVDGVGRSGVGVIGVERTAAMILFVAAETEDNWVCAVVDGTAQTTVYGRGPNRDSVGSFSQCVGPSDGWAS